jgi:hypothetical protein
MDMQDGTPIPDGARFPTESEANILRFFAYKHLPPKLQVVSKAFCDLAYNLVWLSSGPSAELSVALRKLLESKDAAVRASL